MKPYEARSVLVSSFIAYLIDDLQNNRKKPRGTSKEVLSMVKKHIQQDKYNDLVKVSDGVWIDAVDKVRDLNLKIAPFQLVETLWFNSIKELEEVYNDIGTSIVCRYAEHHTHDISEDVIKDTNMFADVLSKATEKSVYEYLRGQKNEIS